MLASAAIILAGGGGISRLLLQNPVSLFLGRISYSLYLVHWPIVVYYKYAATERFGVADTLLVLTLNVALGWLSYCFIETPFRQPAGELRKRRPAYVAAAAIGGLALVGAAGAEAWRTNGWPWRADGDAGALAASLPLMKMTYSSAQQRSNRRRFRAPE